MGTVQGQAVDRDVTIAAQGIQPRLKYLRRLHEAQGEGVSLGPDDANAAGIRQGLETKDS